MNIKEMLDNIPKTNDLVSAYGSINVDDLQEAINRFKYDELLKENNKQKEVLNKIKEHLLNYIEEWQDSEDEYVKGKIDLARDVLCDIYELLEEIE